MSKNRGLQIVRYLADFDRVTVTQVAEDLEMPRHRARGWLKEAVKAGVAVEAGSVKVYRNEAPTYALSPSVRGA